MVAKDIHYHYFGRFLELNRRRQCGQVIDGGRSRLAMMTARIAGKVG